jgi:hypothetical protein
MWVARSVFCPPPSFPLSPAPSGPAPRPRQAVSSSSSSSEGGAQSAEASGSEAPSSGSSDEGRRGTEGRSRNHSGGRQRESSAASSDVEGEGGDLEDSAVVFSSSRRTAFIASLRPGSGGARTNPSPVADVLGSNAPTDAGDSDTKVKYKTYRERVRERQRRGPEQGPVRTDVGPGPAPAPSSVPSTALVVRDSLAPVAGAASSGPLLGHGSSVAHGGGGGGGGGGDFGTPGGLGGPAPMLSKSKSSRGDDSLAGMKYRVRGKPSLAGAVSQSATQLLQPTASSLGKAVPPTDPVGASLGEPLP